MLKTGIVESQEGGSSGSYEGEQRSKNHSRKNHDYQASRMQAMAHERSGDDDDDDGQYYRHQPMRRPDSAHRTRHDDEGMMPERDDRRSDDYHRHKPMRPESAHQRGRHEGQPRRGATKRASSGIPDMDQIEEYKSNYQQHAKKESAKKEKAIEEMKETKPQRKEITIIGGSQNDLGSLIKKVDEQHGMIAKVRGVRLDKINLADVNKYVGFNTHRFHIELEKSFSKIRLLRLKENGNFLALPYARLKINRIQGIVEISENDGILDSSDNTQLTIRPGELLSVRGFEDKPIENQRQKEGQNIANDYASTIDQHLKSGGTRQNRFRTNEGGRNVANKHTGTYMEEQLSAQSNENGFRGITGPPDYKYPLILKSQQKDQIFYFKLREERDLMLHELNNLCVKNNQDVALMNTRGYLMDKIEPVQAFNAWNLSMVCGPTSLDVAQFQSKSLKAKRESISEQSHIIKAETSHVSYIRDGVRCFVSESLRKELFVTDGILFKQSKTSISQVKGKYRRIFLCIDFQKQLIREKFVRTDDKFDEAKDIPFSDVIEFKRLEVDVFKGEHKQRIDLSFKSKMLVRTLKRDLIYFAISDIEREVWLESFGKIVEQNQSGHNNFNLKSTAEIYLKSIEQPKTKTVQYGNVKNSKSKKAVELGDVYRSEYLIVTKLAIKGTAMKAIENLSVLHKAKYHKRFFMLEFGEPYCYWYESENDFQFSKSYRQSGIIGCRILTDAEVNQKMAEREGKRSKSLMRRMFQDKVEKCAWNFPFEIQFVEKSYEMYAPTRQDRDQWVSVISLIAEMNKTSVKTESLNPFEWQKEQELKKQKEDQERKMTQSARYRASQAEIQVQIYEQVHLWLRINQPMMQMQQPEVKDYESDQMTLKVDGVRGMGYLITKQNTALNQSLGGTIDQLKSNPTDELRMTKIELYLNMRIQTLMVQKIGVMGVSKYTFNEITAAETCEFKIAQSDFVKNEAEPEFNHCFKVQVKSNPFKVVACRTAEDRDQWLRCLHLIIQMKNLSIDSSKVSIFVFEKFREQQLKLQTQFHTTIIDQDQQQRPQNDVQMLNNHRDQLNNVSEGDEVLGRQQSIDGVQLSPSLANQTRQNPMQRQQSRLGRCTNSVDEIISGFQDLNSATIALCYRSIEGYLLKEIENAGFFNLARRHLRYFRISYQTGKLCVKEYRDQPKMRTFPLKDILSVRVTRQQDKPEKNHVVFEQLQPVEMIKQYYPFDDSATEPAWPYTFVLELVQRKFTLTVRTRKEMDEWIRIFKLIIKMNKIGFSVAEKNPYVFEEQENVATRASNTQIGLFNSQHKINLSDTQGIKCIAEEGDVDYGVGSVLINDTMGLRDPDIDNVKTASLSHSQCNLDGSMVFQSSSLNGTQKILESSDTRQQTRFAQQMANNISQNFKSIYDRQSFQQQAQQDQQQQPSSHHKIGWNNHQNEPNLPRTNNIGREPIKATMPAPVVNQNITVQNITIKQMTMMQNGSCTNGNNNRNQASNAVVSDYADRVQYDNKNNSHQQQTQPQQKVNREGPVQLQHHVQQRAQSLENIEVMAEFEAPEPEHQRRSSSQLDNPKPRKKKKKKSSQRKSQTTLNPKADDPYFNYSSSQPQLPKQQNHLSDYDTSTIGGVEEIDDLAAYKTDTIQRFDIDDDDDKPNLIQDIDLNHNFNNNDRFDTISGKMSKSKTKQETAVYSNINQLKSNNALLIRDDTQGGATNGQRYNQTTAAQSLVENKGLMFHSSMADSQDEITFINPVESQEQDKDGLASPEIIKKGKPERNDIFQIGPNSSTNNFFENKTDMPSSYDTIQDKVEMIEDDSEYNDIKRQTESGFAKRRNRKKLRDAFAINNNNYSDSSYRMMNNIDSPASFGTQSEAHLKVQDHSEYSNYGRQESTKGDVGDKKRMDQGSQRFYQSIEVIRSPQSQSNEIDARVSRRDHRKHSDTEKGEVRVSLSKVRLAGSKESFNTLEKVRETINMPTLKNKRDDDFISSLVRQEDNIRSPGDYESHSTSKVSIERIKNIAYGNLDNGDTQSYQTISLSQHISIPTIAKKKKKRVVRVRRKFSASNFDDQSSIQQQFTTESQPAVQNNPVIIEPLYKKDPSLQNEDDMMVSQPKIDFAKKNKQFLKQESGKSQYQTETSKRKQSANLIGQAANNDNGLDQDTNQIGNELDDLDDVHLSDWE